MLGTFLIVVWGILTSISQYFLNWHTFTSGGLSVIGWIGLIGFILWFVGGYFTTHPNSNVPKWL